MLAPLIGTQSLKLWDRICLCLTVFNLIYASICLSFKPSLALSPISCVLCVSANNVWAQAVHYFIMFALLEDRNQSVITRLLVFLAVPIKYSSCIISHTSKQNLNPWPLTLAVRWSGGSVESVLLAWSGLTYRLKRKSHCNWVESWSSLSCQDTCLSRGFWHIGTPSMSSRRIRESLLEEWSRVLVS